MEIKKIKPGFTILAILGYLSVLFIVSSIISVTHKDDAICSRSAVVDYAMLFLTDDELKEKGRQLDCSGYTQLVYEHFNIQLPASSEEQYESLPKRTGKPQPGDLLFFSTSNRKIGHVGIAISESKFIHSPGKQKSVRIDSLNHKYWVNRLVGFRTVFEQVELE